MSEYQRIPRSTIGLKPTYPLYLVNITHGSGCITYQERLAPTYFYGRNTVGSS